MMRRRMSGSLIIILLRIQETILLVQQTKIQEGIWSWASGEALGYSNWFQASPTMPTEEILFRDQVRISGLFSDLAFGTIQKDCHQSLVLQKSH